MKKIIYIILPLFLLAYLAVYGSLSGTNYIYQNQGKEKEESGKVKNTAVAKEKLPVNCKFCHESEYPTVQFPGLKACPRDELISDYRPPKDGPDVVVISELSDKYGEVEFSHKIHAEMSEMSEGCTGCHHYNTTGPILNCRHCHQSNRIREDVSVPDLKAAFHRQCLTCHKQWSNENGCSGNCHFRKGIINEKNIRTVRSGSHPEITKPEKITWETNSKTNKIVTFYHNQHTDLFKTECKNCHSDQSCIKCHAAKVIGAKSTPVRIEKSIEEHHRPCIKCHIGNPCEKCHGLKEMEPFEHGRSTGWVLSSFHSKLECSKCHGSKMPYRKLNRNCISCHESFTSKFDHKLKGFVFSEAHSELECANCHVRGDFASEPACSECHDDKSFPADLPGRKM